MKRPAMKFSLNIFLVSRLKQIRNISLFCWSLFCSLENALISVTIRTIKTRPKKLWLIQFPLRACLIYVMNFMENSWSRIISLELKRWTKRMKSLKSFNTFVFGFSKMNTPNPNCPSLPKQFESGKFPKLISYLV